MRRFALALALPLSLVAARAARAEKIAYVDVQKVIGEVEEGKAAKARLTSERDAKKGDLDKRQKELEQLKSDYDRQAAVLTDDAKQAKQQEMQKKYLELQQVARQMQEDLAQKEDEAMRSISEKLLAVVQEVSEKDGFAFVIKKEALLNAPSSADITNEVVRRYNDRFGSGGKKAPKKQAKAGAGDE
jgi:outer membrane protein